MKHGKLVLSLFSMLLMVSAYSQKQGQRPGGMNPNKAGTGKVIGMVQDKVDGSPMEYANLVLYSARDSSIVAGTVTASDGTFILEELRFGRFYAVANFIGYEKTFIHDIKIKPDNPSVDLGTIDLVAASTQLEGVEISADKSHVEYKIDKKIVNVSQDILAQGSSAAAVLENTPSVQVDIEGNVSLRGTSNFEVFVDGRPTVLKGSDALQQIPASTIDHIEIITNPSAKYDPDGVGGIINVILKKQKSPGTNGVVNLSLGTKNKYKLDALLNYKTNRVNVFGGIDFNHRQFQMKGYSNNESYFDDSTSYRDSQREGHITRSGYGIQAGIDYFLTEKSTLTLSGRYGGYGFGRDFNSRSTNYSLPQSETTYTKTESESDRDGTYMRMNLNYILKFDDQGHRLELMGFYAKKKGGDSEEQTDYETDEYWNSIDDYPANIRTSEDEDSWELRLKADYTKPIGSEGKFEAGLQSRFDYETENFLFQDYDYSLSDWIENELYSSEVDFKRNVHAVYGIFADARGSWGYQVGARGEYTDRDIKNAESLEGYAINRFDFFPSLHLSKQFAGDHQVLLSYSRRIDRPNGRELDPFVNYMDEYNIRVGNPTLEPEYIDSYELAYHKRLNKSFVSFETFYRVSNNKITRIRTLNEDGIFIHTYQNMNSDYSLGIEAMLNADFTSWFNLNTSVSVYDYRLDGEIEGEDISTSSTNWTGRLNLSFKMPKEFRAQLTGMYRGPSVTAQGRREGNFTVNAALRKDFFNKRFSATLSARDIFATNRREMESSGTGFYAYDNYQREAPIVFLNLSYIINNYKNKPDRPEGEGGGQDDMDMGI